MIEKAASMGMGMGMHINTKKYNLKHIVSASNYFWNLMYYDVLVDKKSYQISYVKGADRDYYNCAHAFDSFNEDDIEKVEQWFLQKKHKSSIYVDENMEKQLKETLHQKGYIENEDELEKWYHINLSEANKLILKSHSNQFSFCEVDPKNQKQLNSFIKIDAIANAIPPALQQKLISNMIYKRNSNVKCLYFLGFANNIPTTTLALGINKNIGFLAEGGTLPNYRRQGLCNNLTINVLKKCVEMGLNDVFVNCDKDAFSNQLFLKVGFKQIFNRKLYSKN